MKKTNFGNEDYCAPKERQHTSKIAEQFYQVYPQYNVEMVCADDY